MKIAIDIDGVVYPWHYSIYKYCTEFKGFEGNEGEFWDWFRALDKDEQDYLVSDPLRYTDISPSDLVIEALNKLASIGEIYYITARDRELVPATEKFFDEWNLPFKENVLFTSDKATICRLLSIDFFVDDFPKNVRAVEPVCKSYLMAVPHNRNSRDGFNVVFSLNQFYEEIVNETK